MIEPPTTTTTSDCCVTKRHDALGFSLLAVKLPSLLSESSLEPSDYPTLQSRLQEFLKYARHSVFCDKPGTCGTYNHVSQTFSDR
jgi:hypothetical protein